ncbi:MAG: nitrate/nitrite transporter NrtS [Ferruginibacter sp.]
MNTKNILTAILVALVVGSLLNLINNYDVFAERKFSNKNTLKIMLTYITPFFVSLFSSVKATKREKHKQQLVKVTKNIF